MAGFLQLGRYSSSDEVTQALTCSSRCKRTTAELPSSARQNVQDVHTYVQHTSKSCCLQSQAENLSGNPDKPHSTALQSLERLVPTETLAFRQVDFLPSVIAATADGKVPRNTALLNGSVRQDQLSCWVIGVGRRCQALGEHCCMLSD